MDELEMTLDNTNKMGLISILIAANNSDLEYYKTLPDDWSYYKKEVHEQIARRRKKIFRLERELEDSVTGYRRSTRRSRR